MPSSKSLNPEPKEAPSSQEEEDQHIIELGELYQPYQD
jgi:hypothetical protein